MPPTTAPLSRRPRGHRAFQCVDTKALKLPVSQPPFASLLSDEKCVRHQSGCPRLAPLILARFGDRQDEIAVGIGLLEEQRARQTAAFMPALSAVSRTYTTPILGWSSRARRATSQPFAPGNWMFVTRV